MMSAIMSSITTTLPLNSNTSCVKGGKNITETDVDEAVVPDSTTPADSQRSVFSHGQDVLLKHKDGR